MVLGGLDNLSAISRASSHFREKVQGRESLNVSFIDHSLSRAIFFIFFRWQLSRYLVVVFRYDSASRSVTILIFVSALKGLANNCRRSQAG